MEAKMNAILDEYNHLEDKQVKAGHIDELRCEYRELAAQLYGIYILTTKNKKVIMEAINVFNSVGEQIASITGPVLNFDHARINLEQ